jgi:uncharacterized protein
MTRNQENASLPVKLTPTARSTPRRRAARGSHERLLIDAILDEALVCHLGIALDDGPHVLPTAHVRCGDCVYVHGARKNHLLSAAAEGISATLSVTLIDGLVFSREAFHHSMNYRSVVLFGRASEVRDPEQKLVALRALVERTAPGRFDEVIAPSAEELEATLVLAFPILEGSAKVRSGPPNDGPTLAGREIWAGVVPLQLSAGVPVADSLDPVAPPLSRAVAGRAQALGLGARTPYERQIGELLISTDPGRLDHALVHRFLAQESYWASGVSAPDVRASCDQALCFGVYRGKQQLAFARVITDFIRFGYLGDVFVVAEARGQGLSKLLVAEILAHPALARVERWLLGTRDAHTLYARFGFVEVPAGRYMVRPAGSVARGQR